MAYCPNCKESVNDATECPECGAKTVNELPYQTVEAPNTTWVEIASSGTQDQATLISGFLQAEGVPSQIENVKFTMEPINFGAMGDIRIYVAAQDEARAQELLREREREWDRLDDDAETVVTDEGVAQIDDTSSTEPE